MKTFRVGTRGSDLAMAQTRQIISWLKAREPESNFEIVPLVTHGDRFQATPIVEMGAHVDAGIFNSALEEAVLAREVDFATCSFKDVESGLPAKLRAVTVGRREDARDVLVSRHNLTLSKLPAGAQLATSSPRRTSQLAYFRKDLVFHPLRGNITTRVERDVARFDGVILAAAGLVRLGLHERITEWIDESVLLPAPAQGALGCEFLAEREDLAALIASIQDTETDLSVLAEKAVLVGLSGGCYAPIGVLARIAAGEMKLQCRVVSLDGQDKVEDSVRGPAESWRALAEALVSRMEERGGARIVRESRQAMQSGAAAAGEQR